MPLVFYHTLFKVFDRETGTQEICKRTKKNPTIDPSFLLWCIAVIAKYKSRRLYQYEKHASKCERSIALQNGRNG